MLSGPSAHVPEQKAQDSESEGRVYSRSVLWLAVLVFASAVATGCGGGGGSSGGTPVVPPSAANNGTSTSTPQPSPTTTQPVIQTFVLPSPNSAPLYITAGPDGNLWFTEYQTGRIGKITPTGQITEFSDSNTALQPQITVGPDGNIWYPTANQVARITTAGNITHFGPFNVPTGTGIGSAGITTGPDGNVWVAGNGILLKIAPASGALLAQYPVNVHYIVAGADGNLWGTATTQVDRITPSGVVTSFSPANAGAGFYGITTWTDGNIWFTEGPSGIPNQVRVGRITPSGTITEYVVPNSQGLFQITTGSDGNLWIADYYSIYKMTAPGQFTQFSVAQANELLDVTAGPDGNVWFTNVNGASIGRISLH